MREPWRVTGALFAAFAVGWVLAWVFPVLIAPIVILCFAFMIVMIGTTFTGVAGWLVPLRIEVTRGETTFGVVGRAHAGIMRGPLARITDPRNLQIVLPHAEVHSVTPGAPLRAFLVPIAGFRPMRRWAYQVRFVRGGVDIRTHHGERYWVSSKHPEDLARAIRESIAATRE